jgi:hypothetical protein|tara:strand:+ start:728 stop:919 length:192 start_codon:yes stop_codon:yes gene_type:complete
MKIKMLVDMTGLYNGQPIPKKDEIWDTDKNNAVDLIEKGWAEAVKSAPKPKKKADSPAGKEKS